MKTFLRILAYFDFFVGVAHGLAENPERGAYFIAMGCFLWLISSERGHALKK